MNKLNYSKLLKHLAEHSLLIIAILFSACTFNSKKEMVAKETRRTQINPGIKSEGETFDNFYNKFTSDSSFQITRITFPLKGYTNQTNSNEVKFLKKNSTINKPLKVNVLWEKQSWVMHHKVIDTSFKTVRKTTDSTILEKVYLPNSEYEFISLYKKTRGLWYLVYYYDME
jgi:hypothetical protein